jgi:hypothetical protein
MVFATVCSGRPAIDWIVISSGDEFMKNSSAHPASIGGALQQRSEIARKGTVSNRHPLTD